MKEKDGTPQHEDLSPDKLDENQWMTELMRDVDGELDQVTSQLRESYIKLFPSLEKLDKEIEAAIDEGDEMKYQAATIKRSMVQSRLRELEALNIF